MFSRARAFFVRHPVLRDAIAWAIPALLFSAFLRVLLLSYQPYAYWGSDSNSYYSFTHLLLGHGKISLDEKRRLLYPLLMLPISLLPGEPLRWVAWCQHFMGLLTLLPLAYIARRVFTYWRLWIVPVTVIYASMPMIIWYEHELIGESLFFAALVWAFGGWVAWASEKQLMRSRRLFWWFFAGLAVFLLTKPSGRFVWPGICLGLVLSGLWRTLDWRRWAALGALVLATLALGSKKQGAWLFYTASFPLTRLETPLHAEYKAEIRDLVEPLQKDIHVYYLRDEEPFDFLERPRNHPDRPHWFALANDSKKRTRIYMDLALEGVKARPDLFVALSLQRVIASANPSEFKESRFEGDHFARRFEHHYEEGAEAVRNGKPTAIPMLFGLPKGMPLPPYEEFRQRLAPAPDSVAVGLLERWVRVYESASDLVRWPPKHSLEDRKITRARPTLLGAWLLLGAVVSLSASRRSTLGVWTIVVVGYVIGVFLVSLESPRYFGPALGVFTVLLAAPADAALRLLAKLRRRVPVASS